MGFIMNTVIRTYRSTYLQRRNTKHSTLCVAHFKILSESAWLFSVLPGSWPHSTFAELWGGAQRWDWGYGLLYSQKTGASGYCKVYPVHLQRGRGYFFFFGYSSSVNKTRSSRARFLAVTRELLINITVIFKDFLDRTNFDHLLSSVSEKDEDISNKNGFSK